MDLLSGTRPSHGERLKRLAARILVIVDDARITIEIRIALNAIKVDVGTASDAEEGLRLFAEWMPDLLKAELPLQESAGTDDCQRFVWRPRAKSERLYPAEEQSDCIFCQEKCYLAEFSRIHLF